MIRSLMLSVMFSCIAFSTSQESHVSPVDITSNNSFRLNTRAPVDYGSQNSNLWLISRRDPIPASLNWKIIDGDSVSSGRFTSVGTNNYGVRLSSRSSDGNVRSQSAPPQLPNTYVPQAPLYYDRVVTSENRRQSVNGNEVGRRNSNTVLVELPVEVTDGLWVSPGSQLQPQESSLRGRQNTDGENADFKFDEANNSEIQDDISTVFVPNGELTSSSLRDSEFSAQGGLNVPQEQYYELPYPITSASLQDSTVINASTSSLDRPDFNAEEIWLISNNQNPVIPEDKNLTTGEYDIPAIQSSERSRKIHEYGLLTGEDIELLERLGILSALIIDPIQSENATQNFTPSQNSQREFESEPVLIDHGGQSYFTDTERQDVSNLRDVVLIDIPQFTTSEYHKSLFENDGSQNNQKPYNVSLPENLLGNNIKLNSSSNLENDTNLTDRQILEILQILSLNSGDIFNLSTPGLVIKDSKASAALERSNSSYEVSNQPSNFSLPSNAEKLLSEPRTSTFLTSSISSKNPNNETQPTIVETIVFAPPTVSNGRIQPRLLEKLTKGDNEIIESLFKKVIPASESKIEILKKLQDQPKPYVFGFKQDDGNGTLQHRDEKADSAGVVKGTYGYRDAFGVYRNVSYIADGSGFHAVVKTNEPGTLSHNTADVVYMSQTPPLAALVKMMAYRRSKEVDSAIKAP